MALLLFDPVLILNQNIAKEGGTYDDYLTADPTSTVLNLGNAGNVNASSDTYVAFCFTPIKGYSKFGTYIGNANADGTFVYTGFKPAWVMVKRTDSGSSWEIVDNKRSPINVIDKSLYADLNDSEYSFNNFDFLSNGFKLRGTNSNAWNASGGTYFFMAFAESPFVNSNGIPNNAK